MILPWIKGLEDCRFHQTISSADDMPSNGNAFGVPNKDKVGKVTKAQVREIAEKKMQDLSATDIEQAMKIIEGTAQSMGIDVSDR